MPFLEKKGGLTSDTDVLHNELRQSHSELLQIFEESHIGMAVVSLDGKWIRVTRHLCSIFGYTKEELISKKFNDVTHPEDLSLGANKMKEIIQGTLESFELEKRYIHKDGHVVHVLLNSSVIKNLDGSPKYLISQTKDVTALKESVLALKLSEEKFRLLFEKAPIGITHFDKDGTITMVNQVLADMLGSCRDKIIGLNTRVNIKNENQRDAFEAALSGKIGSFEGEYTSITGGKTSYLKAVYAPLFGLGNSVVGGIGITENITAEKSQENKLITSLHEKELLLKEVYHRVKNNLQIIISLINIQINESTDTDYIEKLRETTSRLFAMSKVHEVLCRSGNFISISFATYIKELISNFSYPEVKYDINIEKELNLTIDQTNTLGIIINELITNSVKHNIGQEIVISIRFELPDSELAQLNYSDNGVGLSKKQSTFSDSLGMNLIHVLIEDQLEGKITILDKKGFSVLIEFPIPKN